MLMDAKILHRQQCLAFKHSQMMYLVLLARALYMDIIENVESTAASWHGVCLTTFVFYCFHFEYRHFKHRIHV